MADLSPKGDVGLETKRRFPPEDKIREKPDSREHFQRQWPTVSDSCRAILDSQARFLARRKKENTESYLHYIDD